MAVRMWMGSYFLAYVAFGYSYARLTSYFKKAYISGIFAEPVAIAATVVLSMLLFCFLRSCVSLKRNKALLVFAAAMTLFICSQLLFFVSGLPQIVYHAVRFVQKSNSLQLNGVAAIVLSVMIFGNLKREGK